MKTEDEPTNEINRSCPRCGDGLDKGYCARCGFKDCHDCRNQCPDCVCYEEKVGDEGFEIKKFKKGEQINPICWAAEDLEVWSKYGINVQVFQREMELIIPLIDSDNPGTGNLDNFLADLKKKASEKKIVFVNLINKNLAIHLVQNGIDFSIDGKRYGFQGKE